MARTLYRKIWDSHVVEDYGDNLSLLYIDRQLLHEVSSPQAFAGLGANGAVVPFDVESWRRDALFNSWDKIDIIANRSGAAIDAFETRQRAIAPWLYAGD